MKAVPTALGTSANNTAAGTAPASSLEPGRGCPPATFDPNVAHPARVYSFWLGGKDHFPADREAARKVVQARPEVLAGVRANRDFGRRVVGYATGGRTIRQFLDVGLGLPGPNPTHETAQRMSPACKIAYADNDSLVLAHGRALMPPVPDAEPPAFLHADIRDPDDLLEQAGAVLDFSQPVAVLLLALLHFLPDTDNPASIVARIAAALAPGSVIAISHATGDFAPDAVREATAAYNALVPVHLRTRRQVVALCGDLPVAHPGVVPVNYWMNTLRRDPGPALDLHAAVIALPHPAVTPAPATARHLAGPGRPSAAELAADLQRTAAQFPAYDITYDNPGRGHRYTARARDLVTRPWLVMAATLDDVRAGLDPAGTTSLADPACPPGAGG
jgi:hypothetical protein